MTISIDNSDELHKPFVRFPFFPTPEPGETVYSLFSRTAERSGLPDKHILGALTGQRHTTSLLSALPGNMLRISRSLPNGHPWTDVNQLVTGHTSFQYFTYFDSNDQREMAYGLLVGTDSCIKSILSLGLTSYRGRAVAAHPKFCMDCIRDDLVFSGYSYFHREHQLPYVELCWKHGCRLMDGCEFCGTYPIRGHGMRMVGKCSCARGITPARSIDLPQESFTILKWIADQSAHMVGSEGTGCDNPRVALRELFLMHGFGKGVLLDYDGIASELERKYGAVFLDWLGYPARVNAKPSPWITRFLHEHLSVKRSPSIIYLLFISLIYESLIEFEEDILHSPSENGTESNKIDQQISNEDGKKNHSFENRSDNAWASDLKDLLEASSYRISSLAAKIKVSPYTVAIEAREQRIRVPLSNRTILKHGKEKIDRIRAALESGVPKIEIQNRYQVGEWVIFLIELDELGLNQAHRLAVANNIKGSHRRKVKEFIENDHLVTKADLMKSLSGTYDYMLERDKEWFDLQFAKRTIPMRTNVTERAKKERQDGLVAEKVRKVIEGMISTNEKPKRITRTGVLKRLGYLNQFISHKEEFVLTDRVLSQFEETQAEFLNRKIKWAILRMCKSGQAISVNKLRRVASVSAAKLYERRQYIIDVATASGAIINGLSFFQD